MSINKSKDVEGEVNMLGGKEQVNAHLVNLIAGEGSVGRHEEVATRCWDEGCDDAN